MARILVSWTATTHDFEAGDSIKAHPEGPNAQVHRYHWEYDRHLLLCSARRDLSVGESPLEREVRAKSADLAEFLRRSFPGHLVSVQHLGVRDVISFSEVRAKVEHLLVSLSDHDIDIFVSPGTGVMQTVWYFAHFGLGLRTRMFHLRPGYFTTSGLPERVFEEVEQSTLPQSLVIRERLTGEYPPLEETSVEVDGGYIITSSIAPVYERARRVADTDRVTALILGESGVGKEHLARFVHEASARHEQPFIAVNCSALGDNLLESRLFGHRKGSFTGAAEDRPGVFEEADGGTVFLDEIGDCSSVMQQSLLRVLQEREVMRIGETKPREVDVRIVAATHRDLADYCAQGKFRWDLYYRLAVAELDLPPLRERGVDELEALINHFVQRKQLAFRRPKPLSLTTEARRLLLAYVFPGNVRELEHLIERLYVFCDDEADTQHLPSRIQETQAENSLLLESAERRHIERVIRRYQGNKAQAARALGCALNTLKSKMQKYGIEPRRA